MKIHQLFKRFLPHLAGVSHEILVAVAVEERAKILVCVAMVAGAVAFLALAAAVASSGLIQESL